MKEKRLEIKVIGIGEIRIIRNGPETVVVTKPHRRGVLNNEEKEFIQYYLMSYEDVKDIMNRKYPRALTFPRYR